MLLLIALLLFVWSVADGYSAEAMRRDIENRKAHRRRHEEIMELMETMKKRPPVTKRKVTRTYARDERGRFVAQETVEDVE